MSSVASVYAKALFESLGSVPADQVESELRSFSTVVDGHAELKTLLFGPIATPAEKEGIIKELVSRQKLGSAAQRFLSLLAKKERLSVLEDILAAFKVLRLHAAGGVLGQLVTAEPISEADVDALSQSFTKKLGKKVAFNTTVNPDLLAGVSVTVGGVTYDGSLKSQLSRLRDDVLSKV